MAGKSVLAYVQDCLTSMDSDSVEGLETEEAIMVADMFKGVYMEYCGREYWPWLNAPVTLTSAASASTPTLFTISTLVRRLDVIKYNVDTTGSNPQYREILWKEPSKFFDEQTNLQTVSGTTQLVTLSGNMKMYVYSDRMPKYWTQFTDGYIMMDAYQASVESPDYLATTKVNAWGNTLPTLTIVDGSEIPQLPQSLEPMLQAMLNTTAHSQLKNQESVQDTKKENRQLANVRGIANIQKESAGVYVKNHGRRTR